MKRLKLACLIISMISFLFVACQPEASMKRIQLEYIDGSMMIPSTYVELSFENIDDIIYKAEDLPYKMELTELMGDPSDIRYVDTLDPYDFIHIFPASYKRIDSNAYYFTVNYHLNRFPQAVRPGDTIQFYGCRMDSIRDFRILETKMIRENVRIEGGRYSYTASITKDSSTVSVQISTNSPLNTWEYYRTLR